MSKVLVPDYFERFVCKCGVCRHPCCDGWGINVSKREYFSLIGIDCTEKLRRRIDDAFVVSDFPTDESYASIQPNFLEQCPMLDDDGLCMLQKEKGEHLLPLICRVYPRGVKKYGENHEICMSCSCEETLELLMQSTKPLLPHETTVDLPFEGLEVYGDEPEKDELRHKCIRIMSEPDESITERLEKIGLLCGGKPQEAAESRKQSLVSVKHFIEILCRRSKSIREYGEKVLSFLDCGEDEMMRRFDEAEDHLYSVIPKVEAYAGRIIANHLIYESFPYVDGCETPDSAFAAFCTAVSLLKVMCVCGMAETDDVDEFVDILAFANRFIEHSDYYRTCSRLSHPEGMKTFALFKRVLEKN